MQELLFCRPICQQVPATAMHASDSHSSLKYRWRCRSIPAKLPEVRKTTPKFQRCRKPLKNGSQFLDRGNGRVVVGHLGVVACVFVSEDFVPSIRDVLSSRVNFAAKVARLLHQLKNLGSNAIGNRELQRSRIGGLGLLIKLPVRAVRSSTVAGD